MAYRCRKFNACCFLFCLFVHFLTRIDFLNQNKSLVNGNLVDCIVLKEGNRPKTVDFVNNFNIIYERAVKVIIIIMNISVGWLVGSSLTSGSQKWYRQ